MRVSGIKKVEGSDPRDAGPLIAADPFKVAFTLQIIDAVLIHLSIESSKSKGHHLLRSKHDGHYRRVHDDNRLPILSAAEHSFRTMSRRRNRPLSPDRGILSIYSAYLNFKFARGRPDSWRARQAARKNPINWLFLQCTSAFDTRFHFQKGPLVLSTECVARR
ncbi:hypothetical protein ACJJTC_003253 [Scirpophaga incertulas]